eukprot:7360591-Alexandrium_andersonii.AAC.1
MCIRDSTRDARARLLLEAAAPPGIWAPPPQLVAPPGHRAQRSGHCRLQRRLRDHSGARQAARPQA